MGGQGKGSLLKRRPSRGSPDASVCAKTQGANWNPGRRGLGAQPFAFKMLPSSALEEERNGEVTAFYKPWLWCWPAACGASFLSSSGQQVRNSCLANLTERRGNLPKVRGQSQNLSPRSVLTLVHSLYLCSDDFAMGAMNI